jgi:hypothetical protein
LLVTLDSCRKIGSDEATARGLISQADAARRLGVTYYGVRSVPGLAPAHEQPHGSGVRRWYDIADIDRVARERAERDAARARLLVEQEMFVACAWPRPTRSRR